MDKGWKAELEMSPNCPRCGSSNTKFCYYNNYSLTQPRYFCKGCRRYWTKGGSLRNVPVGGGCRKSRRGKSLRLSTSVVNSKSLGTGYGGATNGSVRQAYTPKGISSVESSRSSMAPDGSHIDLAVVYANFLNPDQDSKTGSEIPELPMELDHSPELSGFSNKHMEHSFQLQEENAMVGCLTNISGFSADASLSGNDHFAYYDEMEQYCSSRGHQEKIPECKSHDTSKYGLAPLPGEEVASQEILWPGFQMLENHTPQMTQLPVFGPETQHSTPPFNDWIAFDLPCYDTFSKT